ncbi:MAG: tetratricopeptide repeat protein [Capsulimonadales bacterium]|nr:tetratricopeptide repeat protein [Capsulimonadales bacterium]
MSARKRSRVLIVILVLLLPIGAFTLNRVQAERQKLQATAARELSASLHAFLEQGNLPEARKVANEWTKLQPENGAAWREAGTVALTENDLTTAKKALEKAAALNPKDEKAQQALGDVLFALKDHAGAETAYRAALEGNPEKSVQAAAKIGLARTLIARKKDFVEAERWAEEATQTTVGDAVACFVLAEARLAQGKGREALRAVRRGLALEPASAGGHTLLVLANRLTGNAAGAKKAEATLTALREYTPNSPNIPDPIRVAQGAALLEEGRYQDALDQFITVLKKDISNAGALEGAGLALWQMDQKSMGGSYLAQSLRHDPERVRARMALGLAAYEQKQYSNAATHFRIVTQVQPGNALAWHGLGQAYAGDVLHEKEAENALRRAVELDGNQPAFRLDYAAILNKNNQLIEAETAYRKGLSLASEEPFVQAQVGAFLAGLPDPQKRAEAQTLLEKALQGDPKNAYAQFHLGRLLVESNRPEDAVKWLEKATRDGQADTKDVWSVLARAYRQLGQRDRAAAAIARAEEIEKRNDRYFTAIGYISDHLNEPAARLELARASAGVGETVRALAEYDTYLRRVPNDSAVKKEKDDYTASLKAAGKLPDMTLYNSINTAARETP